MNGEQKIPPITDPLGRSWRQPHRRFIELDDTHALMSEQTFKGLAEYSTSIPTGVYDGKMWKGFANGEWYLVWFAPDKDPDKARIEKRKILMLLIIILGMFIFFRNISFNNISYRLNKFVSAFGLYYL